MMYDELIKALREYGDIWRDKLLYEAADAIEELLAERDEINYVKVINKQTNSDRIRSMTDEELAGFMFRTFGKAAWCLDNDCTPEESCIPCWLEWLRQGPGDN